MGVTSVILCLVVSTVSVQALLTMRWNGTVITSTTPTLIFHDELFSGSMDSISNSDDGRLVCTSDTPTEIEWRYTDGSVVGPSGSFIQSSGTNPIRSYLFRTSISTPITGARENGLWRCQDTDGEQIFVGLYARAQGLGAITSNVVRLETRDIQNRLFTDNRFILNATIMGGPPTTSVWMLNGQPITNSGNFEISIAFADPDNIDLTNPTYVSKLTVTNVPGMYTYVASNRATPTSVTGAVIGIQGEAPTNIIARQSGLLQVNVSWTAPSVAPSRGYNVSINESAVMRAVTTFLPFMLPSSSQPGSYTIQVGSFSEHVMGRTAELNGFILKGYLPQVITIQSQQVTADSSVSVLISWSPPPLSFLPVGYTVTVSRVMGSGQVLCSSFTEPSQSTSFDLTSITYTLEAFSTYSVELTARFNNFETGSETTTMNFVTMSTVPTRAPSVESNTTTSTSISVSWAEIECIHRNGIITGYVTELRQRGGAVAPNTEVVDRTFTASGLRPFTYYDFGVAGNNSEGRGPFQNVTFRTDEDVPGMVPNLMAEDQFIAVVFSWGAIPTEQQNGIIIAYELTFSVNGSMRMANVTGPDTLVFYEDLDINTTVSDISIRAYTSVGPGEASSIDTIVSIPVSPMIPVVENIMVTSVSETAVMVSWERLVTRVVSGYTVYYSQVSNRKRQASEMSINVDSDSSSTTIDELVTGERYQFQVSATVTFQGDTTEGPRSQLDDGSVIDIETTTTSPPPTEEPGFPVGIVVGVIVGVAAVVIIIVIVIIIYCIVRSRRSRGFHKTYLPDQIELKPSAPSIDDFPEDTEADEGDNVIFAVSVNGHPSPTITWYHDGNEFVGDFSREILDDGSVNFLSAEPKHSGAYRMVARNASGSVEQRVRLTVQAMEVLPVKTNLSNNNNNGQSDVST